MDYETYVRQLANTLEAKAEVLRTKANDKSLSTSDRLSSVVKANAYLEVEIVILSDIKSGVVS